MPCGRIAEFTNAHSSSSSTCRGESSSPSRISLARCETLERMLPATPPIRPHMRHVCTQRLQLNPAYTEDMSCCLHAIFSATTLQVAWEEDAYGNCLDLRNQRICLHLIIVGHDSLQLRIVTPSGESCHVRQSRLLLMLGLCYPFVLFSTPILPAPVSSRRISHRAKTPIFSRNPPPLCPRQTAVSRAQARQQDRGQSPVRDAQDTELATADQQAKQDLYAQLLDRQKSSNPSEVSTSQNVAGEQATPGPGQSSKGSTELIFRLERRGEGWGEEIFPHLVVEQRPLTTTAKRDRNRSTRPKPWTVNLSWSAHPLTQFVAQTA